MAHIVFVCPPLRGHLDPTLALARGLGARGHRVTLIAGDPAGEIIADGVTLVDPGLPAAGLALGRQAGRSVIRATIGAMADRCDALCDVLPALFSRIGADIVVVDQTEPAGALSALAGGLPYASLACALPLDREPGLPPPFVDWSYRSDGSRRWLYEGGHRVTDWLMRPLSRVIHARAEAWGIAGMAALEDTFSRRLQIFQLVKGLDFPRERPPVNAHWIGPLRDERSEWLEDSLDGRPLAFCSLGSLQGHRIDLFRAIAAAVTACGLRPVIAHGGGLSGREAATLPGDPIIADFLPQRSVLARARLAVLHGGMNSVLDALAAGVPTIVIPLAYEQGAIAARLAASGAGLVVPLREVRRTLRASCALVLEETYREHAAGLALEIAIAGGVKRAADLIEAMAKSPSVRSPP